MIENTHDVSSGEYINVTMTVDDEGYYNTTELNTFIEVDDLQKVIQEKGNGENNVFQSEYKVFKGCCLLRVEISNSNCYKVPCHE